MKSRTTLVNYFGSLSQNTNSLTLDLADQMINDAHRYLMQKYFFNESSYSITTIGQQQGYDLPYNYSKLKTGTLTVGNLRWNPIEILTRREWDDLNVFPYYADIPSNFFIYNGKFNLWPIPSTGSTSVAYTGLTGTLNKGDTVTSGVAVGTILTFTSTDMILAVTSQFGFSTGAFTTSGGAFGTITSVTVTPGNVITFNYKIRVPDLSLDDYSAGTSGALNDNLIITGSGTTWDTTFAPGGGNVMNINLWIRLPSPDGDGNWYQIESIDSATQLTLVQPYQGSTVSGASYTIGQIPLLLEDFQDLLVYRPLMLYFSTIQPNAEKFEEFKGLYEDGIKMMDDYVGSKSLDVNLGRRTVIRNPNVYGQNFG